MEYLLDHLQSGAAAAVVGEPLSAAELETEIEGLRSACFEARFTTRPTMVVDAAKRRAFLIASLVSGPCSEYGADLRARALVVAALIFEYSFACESVHEGKPEDLLNAILFYSKGEQEAQAATLAKRAIERGLYRDLSPNPLIQEAWLHLLQFLGREFRPLLAWNTQESTVFHAGLDEEIDEGAFWSALLRACVGVAAAMVWGSETNTCDSRFAESVAHAENAGDTRLLWLALTTQEVAVEMLARSLRAHLEGAGVPGWMTEALTLDSFVELWLPHREAIGATDQLDHGILSEEARVSLINMPTSAGKSLVAELAIVAELAKDRDSKAVWVVPSRALVYEIQSRLNGHLRRLGGSALSVAGGLEHDPDERELGSGRRRVFVLTPEKLDGLLRRAPEFLDSVRLVVVDEMHKIGERGRGWLLETVIAWLLLASETRDQLRLLFMSAVLPNRADFESWLTQGPGLLASCWATWRPTRLALFITHQSSFCRWQTDLVQRHLRTPVFRRAFRSAPQAMDIPIAVLEDIGALTDTSRTMVFYYTKRDVNTFAARLADTIAEPRSVPDDWRFLADEFAAVYGADHSFVRAIRRGVGVDHGDIPLWLRHRVEKLFRIGSLPILVANQAVLEGVNFPIENIVIGALGSRGQRNSFTFRLGVRDFVNLVGRVGRALVDTEGCCFLIKNFYYENAETGELSWDSYATPVPDTSPVRSQLADDTADLDAALDQLSEAFEGMEDTMFDGLGAWRDRLERLHSCALGVLEESGGQDYNAVSRWISRTFAWEQVGDTTQTRLRRLADRVTRGFQVADREVYRLASLTGLSTRSARAVGEVAREMVALHEGGLELHYAEVLPRELLNRLVELREAWRSRPVVYGPRRTVPRVDHYRAVCEWVSGESWGEVEASICRHHGNLAVETKAQIAATYVSQMFEYRLPWILGALALAARENQGAEELCAYLERLPALVRYGVPTPDAVDLARFCGAERRIALVLHRLYLQQDEFHTPREWLRGPVLEGLEGLLAGEPPALVAELRDRLRHSELRKTALRRRGHVTVRLAGWERHSWQEVSELTRDGGGVSFRLRAEPENPADRFATAIDAYLTDEPQLIGYVPRAHTEEAFELLSWGRQVRVSLAGVTEEGQPRFRLELLPIHVF